MKTAIAGSRDFMGGGGGGFSRFSNIRSEIQSKEIEESISDSSILFFKWGLRQHQTFSFDIYALRNISIKLDICKFVIKEFLKLSSFRQNSKVFLKGVQLACKNGL